MGTTPATNMVNLQGSLIIKATKYTLPPKYIKHPCPTLNVLCPFPASSFCRVFAPPYLTAAAGLIPFSSPVSIMAFFTAHIVDLMLGLRAALKWLVVRFATTSNTKAVV